MSDKSSGAITKTAKVVVPAHLASKRMPRKVLVDINGIPMLKRILIQCSMAVSKKDVYVATPDREVYTAVKEWGYQCCMSDQAATNGTSAIASIAPGLDTEHIVNVQGDHPFIPPNLIRALIDNLVNSEADVVTPVYKITSVEDIVDVGVAKVIRDFEGWALYFSRNPVPYVRDIKIIDWPLKVPYWAHYGIYGYKKEVLLKLHELKNSYLESAEGLEQLGFLQNGLKIFTFETEYRQLSVDTIHDLNRILKYVNE